MTKPAESIIGKSTSIGESLRRLNTSTLQILIVVEDNRVAGTVTDGDIRRGLLKGCTLETPVVEVMTSTPVVAPYGTGAHELIALMRARDIRYVPLVDRGGGIVDIAEIDDLVEETQPNKAFIMAGGLGQRLRPLTEGCPKPMLNVGGRPLLETLILQLHAHGFVHITLAIHYLGDQIKAHFGDGSRFDVDIAYIEEEQRRGTAGALALLPSQPREPLLVLNGDLLTAMDFRAMLTFHESTGGIATMGVRNFRHEVPYGVINTHGVEITSIDEKPSTEIFVNAGVYVVEPEFVAQVPDGHIDMTDMCSRLLERREHRVAAYPIHEYWRDIGRREEFEQANAEYPHVFGMLMPAEPC